MNAPDDYSGSLQTIQELCRRTPDSRLPVDGAARPEGHKPVNSTYFREIGRGDPEVEEDS